MTKEEYIKQIDVNIIPLIRKQLIEAYSNGKSEATIKEYLKKDSMLLLDLGLPSGTLWCYNYKQYTFKEAKESGHTLPTAKQIEEIKKCYWCWEHWDGRHCHVKGLNSEEYGVAEYYRGTKLCLWSVENKMDKNFKTMGECLSFKGIEGVWGEENMFAGDRFYTLFVIPQELINDLNSPNY